MKKKTKKPDKKDEPIIIHPGTQAIIDDSVYDNAAKLQRAINKFLKKEISKKDKKAKEKVKKNPVIKKLAAPKKSQVIKKATKPKK